MISYWLILFNFFKKKISKEESLKPDDEDECEVEYENESESSDE